MSHPKGRESVRSNLERALVDPVEELPKHASAALRSVAVNGIEALTARSRFIAVVIEDNGRRRLVLDELSEDGSRRRGTFFVVIGATQFN